jgi:predicted hydrocarbon binding protein
MIGLIQKILLDLVEERAGPEAVTDVKKLAGVPVDRIFRIGEIYSDTEWQNLLSAACRVLCANEEQVMELYADAFGRDALVRFSKWFEMSANSREFLERQVTIHNVFASGMVDPNTRKAVVDKFRIETFDDKIVTHYRSPNKLCSLYKALARWMFNHYGDDAEIEETKCMQRGDEECEIHVIWKNLKERRNEAQRAATTRAER